MPSHIYERIAILGLGLIGSSIARAATDHGIVKTIVGYDRNEISVAYAVKHGFITQGTTDIEEAIKTSALVIIATSPSSLSDIAAAIAPHLMPGAVVMDVCSVKQAAIAAIGPHLPEYVHYIPAHPIAGSEQSGVANGRSDLFEKKRIILTPEHPNQDFALQNVTSFWKALGGRCEAMPAPLHDLIYAYVSHLPQLLAFAATAPLEIFLDVAESDALLQKFLRLAGSNPDMWIEIFILNKQNILTALDRYLDVMAHIISEFSHAPPHPEHRLSPTTPEYPLSLPGRGQGEGSNRMAPNPHPDPLPGREREKESTLARMALFPRLAASCLITTVMEAEKKRAFLSRAMRAPALPISPTPPVNHPKATWKVFPTNMPR